MKQNRPSDNARAEPITSFPSGTANQRNMLSLSVPKNWVSNRPMKLGEANPPRPRGCDNSEFASIFA